MHRFLLCLSVLLCCAALRAADRDAVVEHYAEIVHASYEDALIGAEVMRATIAAFLDQPSEEGLRAAKAQWLQAREPYGQTEVYRFYGGPIDDEDGPEAQLNAWPLDEAYIDRTGFSDGGIINDVETYGEITIELLQELNEKDGEANISTGYHAIEFLLWGQDLNAEGFDHAGQRPLSDYTTDANAARRATYLRLVTDLLIADLESMVAAWQPGVDGNYRSTFVAAGDASLGKIIVGIGSLGGGELAGERMAVALENKDQEDEHSCFSDNTHRDIVLNQLGIANVWRGSYRRIDGSVLRGPGLRALVVDADEALAQQVDAAIAAALDAVEAIQPPFDRELVEDAGRARIQAAIETLWAETRLWPAVAAAIAVEAQVIGL